MKQLNFFKHFLIYLLPLFTNIAVASVLSDPIIIEHFVYKSVFEPVFEPIEIERNYVLQIDSKNSFFEVQIGPEEHGYNFPYGSDENYPSSRYSISGEVGIYDRYFEDQSHISERSLIKSISFQSEFNNIDLSSQEFWDTDFELKSDIKYKPGYSSGWICSCSYSFYPTPYLTTKGTNFDGENLVIEGSGYFKIDDDTGRFILQPDSDSTHRISYHLEANVVSTVPIPGAFILLLSGIGGLTWLRRR